MVKRLFVDIETCSTVDIKKTGAYAYAEHGETQIICMAWELWKDDLFVEKGSYYQGDIEQMDEYSTFYKLFEDADEVLAHNAEFEMAVLDQYLHWMPDWYTGKWRCTMVQAAHNGLPLGLDEACMAVGLSQGKNVNGAMLMKRMARPRTTNANGNPVWWHETDHDKYRELMDYCENDVNVTRQLHAKMFPLGENSLKDWQMMVDMNRHGLPLDLPRVVDFRTMAEKQTAALDDEMNEATNGHVPTTRAIGKLQAYVAAQEQISPGNLSFAKDKLDALIKRCKHDHVKVALQIRQRAAKSSVSKLKAMEACVCHDNRVRGTFQHMGAFRTGRVAGRLIQPQNMPRPEFSKKDIEEAYMDWKAGARPDLSLDFISSALRSCINTHGDGRELVVFDFAQIEARVLAWLANQLDVLEVFIRGEDLYEYTADRVGQPGHRPLGKVLALACGFGMGSKKFQETADTFGVQISLTESDVYVQAWRQGNIHIVHFWKHLQTVVRNAISQRNTTFKLGPKDSIWVKYSGRTLKVRLPSGRVLIYQDPRIVNGDICYMGQNQYSRKWEETKTYGGKLAENITQAVARDVLYWLKRVLWTSRFVDDASDMLLVGSVHDEVICEVDLGCGAEVLRYIEETIQSKNLPDWMEGLPLDGEGEVTAIYGK